MATRVIVLAAGSGSRWDNFRGTPKHLTVIEKEVLLERTVRQFLKYTDDVCVVGSNEQYKVDGASLYIVKSPNTNWKDGAKFMSSKNLWLRDGRTVLVFGDVYFTNDAVKKIMSNKDEWKWFLRSKGSELTGCEWKEIFAFSFNGHMANQIAQHVLHLISLNRVEKQAGWELYRTMLGSTTNGLFNNTHFVEIDDWTEDFDFPDDLLKWEENRKELRKKKKEYLVEQ